MECVKRKALLCCYHVGRKHLDARDLHETLFNPSVLDKVEVVVQMSVLNGAFIGRNLHSRTSMYRRLAPQKDYTAMDAESSSQALERYIIGQLAGLSLTVPEDDVQFMARFVEEEGLLREEKVEGVRRHA